MPTYAYACKDCDHAFDIQQSFSDDSLTVCPECNGVLRKKFNSVGVVFKGSGFYRNDSRDTKTSAEVGASSSSDATAASPAGTSNPSKGTTSDSSGSASSTSAGSAKASASAGSPATSASAS